MNRVARHRAPGPAHTHGCLVPVWDGPYRMPCALGAGVGRCAYHGPIDSHPDDGRPCNPHDGYCHTHGVYLPVVKPPGRHLRDEELAHADH